MSNPEKTVNELRALALDTGEAARLTLARHAEGSADDFLTELEFLHSDAWDGVQAFLDCARAAVEVHGVRFSDWVAKCDEALEALGNINADGVPGED